MSDSPVPTSSPPGSAVEDNTAAIVSYLFGIGLIIAVVMHSSKKTLLGAYHLRQALGLVLVAIAGTILLFGLGTVVILMSGVPLIGWMLLNGLYCLAWAFRIGMIILSVFGILAAVNREQKPLPLFGAISQRVFATLFT